MNPPIEPKEEDCCGSGCDPCVFDIYRHKMLLFEKYSSGQLDRPSSPTMPNLITDTKYTAFKIVYNEQLCDSHNVIAFRHCSKRDNVKLLWKPGQHFLMKFVRMDSVKSKAYTPLLLDGFTVDYDFLIIVKKYENGLVSGYLHSKQIGDEVLWRGPYGNYEYIANKFKRICMISQGTGIAPFYSIINLILQNENDFTNVVLLCCFSCFKTILLRKPLYMFRQYWNFNYKMFVSEKTNDFCRIMYKEPIEYRKLNISDIKNSMWPLLQNDGFLLCGSRNFMNYYAENLLTEGVDADNIVQF